MATDIIKSIGTGGGRDYSSLSAWAAAIPANLVTADERWIGEVYNDAELDGGSGNSLLLTGKTTDATRSIILRAASGQSFKDHANKATNPLRYDASKGAAITGGGGSGLATIRIEVANVTIEGLQIKCKANGGAAIHTVTGANNLVVKDCILHTTTSGTEGTGAGVYVAGTNSFVINCAHVAEDINSRGFGSAGNNPTFINCTTINLGVGTNVRAGFTRNYDAPIAKNCASFGYTDGWTSGWSSSSEYNATDGTTVAGTTGAQTGLTDSNQFENVASISTVDLRLKAGSALINAGNTDATNAPNDIIGTARGSGTAGDIGAWEYSTGSANGSSTATMAGVSGSAAGYLAQIAAPASDAAVGSWQTTGANLFSVLDEYPANDSDHIFTFTKLSPCRIKLGTLTDPVSSIGHKMYYRIKGDGSATMTVRLYTGGTASVGSGTLVKTWTHAPAPASLTDYEQTLSGGEADAITDYANLYLEFEAS